MRRYFVLLAALMVLLLAAAPRSQGLTDEELKQQFLDSRSDSDSSPSPTPHHHHAEESPTPHKKHSPTPEPEETPHHKHSPTPEPEETPHHKKHSPTPGPEEAPHKRHSPTPEPTETPTPEPSPYKRPHLIESEETLSSKPRVTPTPRVTPSPRLTPAPGPQPFQPSVQTYPAETPSPALRASPAPTPPPTPAGAQIDIQKEGIESQGGYEPPPPTPSHHHWWQIFGSGEDETQYHYLTKAIREAIDRAPVARNRWRFIVVHNSGTRQGNARIFDYYHKYVRKMPNGLAYHFVIGNGTSSGNGQIEIGGRWIKQLQGGHVHSDYLNNIALGICLVGDFNRDLPTKEQLAALDELIRYLRVRVGKIDRKPAIVKAHREINPPRWPTDCPGDRFPYEWLHRRFD